MVHSDIYIGIQANPNQTPQGDLALPILPWMHVLSQARMAEAMGNGDADAYDDEPENDEDESDDDDDADAEITEEIIGQDITQTPVHEPTTDGRPSPKSQPVLNNPPQDPPAAPARSSPADAAVSGNPAAGRQTGGLGLVDIRIAWTCMHT